MLIPEFRRFRQMLQVDKVNHAAVQSPFTNIKWVILKSSKLNNSKCCHLILIMALNYGQLPVLNVSLHVFLRSPLIYVCAHFICNFPH